MNDAMSNRLFALDQHIRYVAINQNGTITEMTQNPKWPSFNPADTDRMEELIVNPAVLDLTRRRGNIDLGGVQYVAIRYGMQYQLIFPYREGHMSIGVALEAQISDVAEKIHQFLSTEQA